MKQISKAGMFICFCGLLITVSLSAGRDAYKNCSKCHFNCEKKEINTNILTGLFEPYPSGIKP